MEKAYKAGKVTEEEVLDGVLELGDAYNRMKEFEGKFQKIIIFCGNI